MINPRAAVSPRTLSLAGAAFRPLRASFARALFSFEGGTPLASCISSSTQHCFSTVSPSGGCPITGSKPSVPLTQQQSSLHDDVHLKEVPTLPYLGSLIPQYSNTPKFEPDKFYDFYPLMRKRFGEFYKMGMPGLGKGRDGIFYVVTSPTEMQKILRQETRKQPYPKGIIESQWPLATFLFSEGTVLGRGTNDEEDRLGFTGNGETWKRLRTFLQTDLLSPQAATGYIPITVEAAKLASKGAPASSEDLNSYTNRCSFDLFNSLMFGQLTQIADPSSEHDEESVLFCDSTVNAMDVLFQQMTDPMQKILFDIGIKTQKYKNMGLNFSMAFEIGRKKCRIFWERSAANQLTEAEKSSYLERAIMRQKEEGGKNCSDEELVELINMGLLAAIDTTSSLLSWNILHLALNPEVQEKLQSELIESFHKCGGLNFEALRKGNVPYLHAVLRETHRISPATPITVIKENFNSDIEIHGSIIPKDSLFLLDSYSLGICEDIIDEPNEFRPERWLEEAVEARKGTPAEVLDHPFYRDSFSQGSRKCPGSRVAKNEVLIMIAQLVLDWKMSPPAGYTKDDVTYKFQGMIHPIMPKLNFVARDV